MADENKNTVSIFGKEYPIHMLSTYKNGKPVVIPVENSTSFSEYLPDFFAGQEKHFSKEEYYAKVVEKHPEYKKKLFESLPSEKDIEKFISSRLCHGALDGATSVPKAEKELGIKIGGGYVYPQGMSDIEYHAHYFRQRGFDMLDSPINKMEAYAEAWQELHYGSKEHTDNILKKQCEELVELNPQLKDVKLDWNDSKQLCLFNAGVNYNFPKEDIQLFIDEKAKGVDGIAKSRREYTKEKLKQKGIPDCFNWVLSDATIDNIAKRLREKEGKTAEAQVQNEEKKDIKTPKEKVAGRLKSWGIEDGSYMLLTREDHARVGYGNDDYHSVDSYFEHGQKEVQKSGKNVVYGRNNGIYGAYFDEGVYVLSTNDKMGEALYRMGEDVGLGVMLSNAEKFENYALKANWERVKDNGNKINVEMENQRTTQKRNLAYNQVQTMMNEIGQTADKHDASGRLKADLEKAYLQSEDKMLSLEFWGEVAQKYALNSPTGKEACLKDIGALGLKLSKDIKQNQNNEYYSAAKKSLTDEKSHPKEGKNNVMVAMQMRNNVTLR